MNGWWSVAAVVATYDAWALVTSRPTLSGQYRVAAREHQLVMGIATGYLVAHLWGVWPHKLDPFNLYVVAVRQLA